MDSGQSNNSKRLPSGKTTDLADVYGNGYRQCVVWWGMRRLMSTKPESDTGPYHTTH